VRSARSSSPPTAAAALRRDGGERRWLASTRQQPREAAGQRPDAIGESSRAPAAASIMPATAAPVKVCLYDRASRLVRRQAPTSRTAGSVSPGSGVKPHAPEQTVARVAGRARRPGPAPTPTPMPSPSPETDRDGGPEPTVTPEGDGHAGLRARPPSRRPRRVPERDPRADRRQRSRRPRRADGDARAAPPDVPGANDPRAPRQPPTRPPTATRRSRRRQDRRRSHAPGPAGRPDARLVAVELQDGQEGVLRHVDAADCSSAA